MREKKNNWKGFALGMVIVALLAALAVPALATSGKKEMEVEYTGIHLHVDGIPITGLKGDKAPFVSGGTTYLPVRAVGEALGKTVRWDGETKTVHLGELPQATYLVDVCKVANSDLYRAADHKAFTFKENRGGDGKRYSQGFMLGPSGSGGADVYVELGGKYESLTFDFLNEGIDDKTVKISAYLDGKKNEAQQIIEGIKDGGIQTVTVPLNYAQTIKFNAVYGIRRTSYVANAVLSGERAVTEPAPPPANATYLVDTYPLKYSYTATKGKYFNDMFGNQYTNGIIVDYQTVPLNDQYKTLKATAIGSDWGDSSCEFLVDGETVKKIVFSADMGPQAIEIPLNYGMELQINGSGGSSKIFLADAYLE